MQVVQGLNPIFLNLEMSTPDEIVQDIDHEDEDNQLMNVVVKITIFHRNL